MNNKNSNIKWAQMTMAYFIMLALVFNSQSMVNFSKLWDVNDKSIYLKNHVLNWHKKMEILGATGPRKLIEDFSKKIKNLKFKNQNETLE